MCRPLRVHNAWHEVFDGELDLQRHRNFGRNSFICNHDRAGSGIDVVAEQRGHTMDTDRRLTFTTFGEDIAALFATITDRFP
jgi:hypothetical protein